MQCCSRSTFGITIGGANILINIGVCIGMTLLYRDAPKINGKFRVVVGLIVIVGLAMVAANGLLIFGIIKRLHKLIYPWLVASGALFICNCGRALFAVILTIKESTPFQTWYLILLVDILALGLTFWPIFTLYRDIEELNNQHLEELTMPTFIFPAAT